MLEMGNNKKCENEFKKGGVMVSIYLFLCNKHSVIKYST